MITDVDTVKFEIWDTAGQERYRAFAPMYYRGAQSAVVVYSIVDAGSFDGAKDWIAELRRQADAGIVIALVGNKVDLAESRVVPQEAALDYAREQGLIYLETSAKDAVGVGDLFAEIAKRVPRLAAPARRADIFVTPAAAGSAKPAGGCCG